MKCPFCSEETKVVDTRDNEASTRRRRECEKCGKRFTTYEKAEISLMVMKKDGRREPYSREKLLIGILKACEKRPVTKEMIEEMVSKIENEIRESDEAESKKIGELVMKHLRLLDKIAYIRFASVYRAFEDPREFEQEVKMLKKSV
ncbi:MAG: transcriptional regulator NrdR [Candidatus Aenigmarchaeota archaeon]|nr:transcriptional regulator NrdR [Candidatus Aenigmarchaeota archaeon]